MSSFPKNYFEKLFNTFKKSATKQQNDTDEEIYKRDYKRYNEQYCLTKQQVSLTNLYIEIFFSVIRLRYIWILTTLTVIWLSVLVSLITCQATNTIDARTICIFLFLLLGFFIGSVAGLKQRTHQWKRFFTDEYQQNNRFSLIQKNRNIMLWRGQYNGFFLIAFIIIGLMAGLYVAYKLPALFPSYKEPFSFHLDVSIINTLIISTTATILSIFFYMVKRLFPSTATRIKAPLKVGCKSLKRINQHFS